MAPNNVIPFGTGRDRPPTMEEMGLTQGSSLVATPEEQAAIEEQERQRVEAANAHIDAVPSAQWACRCCGGDAFADPVNRLCEPRRIVLARLRAERLCAEELEDGRTRFEAAGQYLDRQQR